MRVLVDELVLWNGKGFFRNRASCHLLAADLSPEAIESLHALAAAIGMRRTWFQAAPPASWPHYDLTEGRRARAIAAGAVEITNREGAQIRRALKQGGCSPA